MKKIIHVILLMFLSSVSFPVFAQKTQPVVDKETIKKVQQELKTQMPKAKIKTIKYDDGGVYVGECDKKIKQGVGTMFFATGDVYIGQWESDAISGEGSMIYANGDKYDGEWKEGTYDGHGEMVYANGGKYNGEWKNGVREGQGEMAYANGDKYEGEWKSNNYDGFGVKTFTEGYILKYEGEWKEGQMDGKGIAYTRNTDKAYREGLWKNNIFTSGLWALGGNSIINGQIEEDKFIGEAKIYTKNDWVFDGIAYVDLRGEEGERPVLMKKGKLSKGETVCYDGSFSAEQLLTSGTIQVEIESLSLVGEVTEDSLKGKLSFFGTEVFEGTFSSKDSYGTLKNFEGTYSIVDDENNKYSFCGKMLYHRPVEGVLDTGRSILNIKVDYDSNDQATVSILNSRTLTIPYTTNIRFFKSIQERLKPAPAGFKSLEGVVYVLIEDNTPLRGLDRVWYWAFFEDGIVERYYKHIPSQAQQQVYKSKPKGRMVTCPSCKGSGTIVESGYRVDGTAYKKTITCPLCNGKGKSNDDLSNILDEGLSNFWGAVGTVQEMSDGRTAQDVLKEVGVDYHKYTLSSGKIHLDTQHSTITDFTLVNGTWVCKQEPSFVLKPLPDSKSLYNTMKEKATESYYHSATGKIDRGTGGIIDLLPFSIPINDSHIYNNEIIYKATNRLKVATNALVLWDSFEDGIGRIGLDRNIEICMFSVDRETFCEQMGYRLLSDKCWIVLSKDRMRAPYVKELQVPTTVKDICIEDSQLFALDAKIILPLDTPPRLNFYLGSNYSQSPNNGLIYYVPPKSLKAFQEKEYWRGRIKPMNYIFVGEYEDPIFYDKRLFSQSK